MPDAPWSFLSPFTQTIGKFINNPVTDWERFYSPSVNFNFNPQDAPIEAHVLSKVGSYGSQISTMFDVLEVLIAKMPKRGLDEDQRKVLKDFADLRVKADKAVDEARGLATPEAIVAAVKSLEKRHPEQMAALKAKLGELGV